MIGPNIMFNGVGSHGTTQTRYDSIAQTGFQISATGRRGKGVYFWHGSCKQCSLARRLASGWYRLAFNRGDFVGDADSSGIIIWATIKSQKSEFLDITTPDYQHLLRGLLEKHIDGLKQRESRDFEAMVSQVHDLVVDRVERLGCSVKVVLASIVAPKKMNDPLLPYLGDPFAYVVRDSSCIELDLALTEGIEV